MWFKTQNAPHKVAGAESLAHAGVCSSAPKAVCKEEQCYILRRAVRGVPVLSTSVWHLQDPAFSFKANQIRQLGKRWI